MVDLVISRVHYEQVNGTDPTLRALVVDDEAALADVVASYLRREQFEVRIANDGPSALVAAPH